MRMYANIFKIVIFKKCDKFAIFHLSLVGKHAVVGKQVNSHYLGRSLKAETVKHRS